MIEVFKTNVCDAMQAQRLLTLITEKFPEFEANFDLQDPDRILRVKSDGTINASMVVKVLEDTGINAQLLCD